MIQTHLRRLNRPILALAAGLSLLTVAFTITGATVAAASGEAAAGAPAIEQNLQFAALVDGVWYRVTVDFYLREGATGADAAAAAEALAARFEGAYPIADDGVSAQFLVSGPRWPGNTLTWQYDPSGRPADIADGLAEITAAAATWNSVGANWQFVAGGRTEAGTGACGTELDGQNTIGWAAQAGSVLAVTCTWSRPEANGGETFVEFDMEFDPTWTWTTSTSNVNTDLQSVALHEMGHALGLDHTAVTCPGSTMCATYSAGVILHTLSSDDLAGLFAVYGTAATPPAAPPKVTLPQERGTYRIIALGASRN